MNIRIVLGFMICCFLSCTVDRMDSIEATEVSTFEYATVEGEVLYMDVYSPALASKSERPAILYVHGGGFQGGSRDGESIRNFFRKAVTQGFTGVSISYRLLRKDAPTEFGCQCPSDEKSRVFREAANDVNRAANYLAANHGTWDIDPHKIILMGSSAGAEAILHAAFAAPAPVKYAGVVALAGALTDTAAINKDNAVPIMFFHGTDDPLVPYATAPHHYCKPEDPGYLILNGSATIAEKLLQLSTSYWLHTTCNAGHELAEMPLIQYAEEILSFCRKAVVEARLLQTRTYVHQGAEDCSAITG